MAGVLILLTLIGGFAAIGAMTTIAHAAAKRLRGGSGTSEEVRRKLEETEQRLSETEARLDELSGTESRLLELDERMEFAERLLQQQRDRERLPGGD